MPQANHRRLKIATVTYWLLLSYIIVALVWWFISLERQNRQMVELKLQSVETKSHIPGALQQVGEPEKINREAKRNTAKYIGEGITFLILILIGASFVYRSVRRQFRLQQQQQNFMMAVTHELKTPVSVARLNLETMLKYSLDEEKQKKLIRMTIEETSRLNFLTNNILIASQLEGRGYKMSKEELNFSDLLKDCVSDFKQRFPERFFFESIATDVEIKGDALLLQMLVNNLLENAIKYSAKEAKISIILQSDRRQICLNVIDEGPGISDEEKKKVFNKFYRIGNEATRKTKGTGLGLYLCRIISRDHNADISVTNNTTQGSNFVVNFMHNK